MKILSLAEIKNILSKLSKEREELTREQKISLEHSEHISNLSIKKTKELINQLTAIEKIEIKQATQIANLLPNSKEELMAIYSKETYIPSDKEADTILKIIKEYT